MHATAVVVPHRLKPTNYAHWHVRLFVVSIRAHVIGTDSRLGEILAPSRIKNPVHTCANGLLPQPSRTRVSTRVFQ